MPRNLIALPVSDLSSFTKALRTSLAAHCHRTQALPSHLALMNMAARAAGRQNVQSLKAASVCASTAGPREGAPPAAEPTALVAKTLAQFDSQGRLLRLPNKLSVQKLAVWCLWTRFSAKRPYTEHAVNEVLKAYHTFGDHATLRRELVESKLLTRTPDCRVYRKLAAKPTAEIAAMLERYHSATKSPAATPAV